MNLIVLSYFTKICDFPKIETNDKKGLGWTQPFRDTPYKVEFELKNIIVIMPEFQSHEQWMIEITSENSDKVSYFLDSAGAPLEPLCVCTRYNDRKCRLAFQRLYPYKPSHTTHTLPSIAPLRTAVGLTFQLPPLTRRGTSLKHTVQKEPTLRRLVVESSSLLIFLALKVHIQSIHMKLRNFKCDICGHV